MDRPNQARPWRAQPDHCCRRDPRILNLAFMGMGADVTGVGALRSGLIFAALIVPVFVYRHYLQDKGQFPPSMVEDLEIGDGQKMIRRAAHLALCDAGAGRGGARGHARVGPLLRLLEETPC